MRLWFSNIHFRHIISGVLLKMQIARSHSRIPVLVKHREVDLHFLTSRQSPGHFKKQPSRVIIIHDVLGMRRNSVLTEGSY